MRSTWVSSTNRSPARLGARSSTVNGSGRWYRTPRNSTTSNVPTPAGVRSRMRSTSRSSTADPSARRARSKPAFDPRSFSADGRQPTGSTATTRAAPRRSHSKEKKPSHAPTSSTVLPLRSSGRWSQASLRALSSTPGVTIPLPRSLVWNQRVRATAARRSSGAGRGSMDGEYFGNWAIRRLGSDNLARTEPTASIGRNRGLALERQDIEKRDFPIGRRGYDPDAVDRHLREIAAAVEELRAQAAASAASG